MGEGKEWVKGERKNDKKELSKDGIKYKCKREREGEKGKEERPKDWK